MATNYDLDPYQAFDMYKLIIRGLTTSKTDLTDFRQHFRNPLQSESNQFSTH